MNCRAVVRDLDAYLDGELPGDLMLEIRAHLHDCRACAAEHAALRDVKLLLSRAPEPEPAPDLEERLLRAVRTARPVEAARRRRPFAFLGLALTGVLALAAFAARPAPPVARDTRTAEILRFDVERDQLYTSADLSSGVPVLSTSDVPR